MFKVYLQESGRWIKNVPVTEALVYKEEGHLVERMDELDFPAIQYWGKAMLTATQKAFSKAPTSANWRNCLSAMLVHQQLCFADKHPTVKATLILTLPMLEQSQWPEEIVQFCTGQSIGAICE